MSKLKVPGASSDLSKLLKVLILVVTAYKFSLALVKLIPVQEAFASLLLDARFPVPQGTMAPGGIVWREGAEYSA